jgi:hypothetical protein
MLRLELLSWLNLLIGSNAYKVEITYSHLCDNDARGSPTKGECLVDTHV